MKESSLTEDGYYQRYFINFDLNMKTNLLFNETEILDSLVGLSRRIVIELLQLYDMSILNHKLRLDDIKKKALGLGSAMKKGNNDKIANYSSYLFGYQQFFHSSLRARQGIILEKVIEEGIKLFKPKGFKVYTSKNEQISNVYRFFGLKPSNLDIDVVILSIDESLLLPIQLRSRDDTGGTTAKASNVDLLNDILKKLINIKYDFPNLNEKKCLYTIVIWEPRDGNQKNAMKMKIWQSLEQSLNLLGSSSTSEKFFKSVETGYHIPSTNIILQIIYGFVEFSKFLSIILKDDKLSSFLKQVWSALENWDDLWLTYTIASLELPLLATYGKSNLNVIEERFVEDEIDISNYIEKDMISQSKKLTAIIAPKLRDIRFPPFIDTMQDQMNYIRDLILVYALKFLITKKDIKRMKKHHEKYVNQIFDFF